MPEPMSPPHLPTHLDQTPAAATEIHEVPVGKVAADAIPVGAVAAEPVAVAIPVAERAPENLELRVEALERRVDHLNNSPELEERITTRVLERLPQSDRWYTKLNPFRGVTAGPLPSGWFVYDLLSELRFLGAMIFDHRFSMSWISRGVVIGSLVLAFTTSFWLACIASIPILGWIVNTLIILFCGGLIFKTLHRETDRYRKFLESTRT